MGGESTRGEGERMRPQGERARRSRSRSSPESIVDGRSASTALANENANAFASRSGSLLPPPDPLAPELLGRDEHDVDGLARAADVQEVLAARAARGEREQEVDGGLDRPAVDRQQ